MREDSVLSYYKRLIALRKSNVYRETFTYGKFIPAYEDVNGIFAYYRENEESGQKILIAANYGETSCVLDLEINQGSVLLSNEGKEADVDRQMRENHQILLESCESVIILFYRWEADENE